MRLRPLHRSPSRIQRWVQDQQKRLSGEPEPEASPESTDEKLATSAAPSGGHPWLAYPDVGAAPSSKLNAEEEDDEASIADSFVVIDEELSNVLRNASVTQVSDPSRDKRPRSLRDPQLGLQRSIDLSPAPETPRKSRSSVVSFGAPSPLRNIALHFSGRKVPASPPPPSAGPQTPSRSSLFQRVAHGRQSAHTHSPSLASSVFTQRPAQETATDLTTPSPSSWKVKRLGMHAHFASSPAVFPDREPAPRLSTSTTRTGSSDATPQPRPSTSSSNTSDALPAPPRPSMSSTRTRASEYFYRAPSDPSTGPQKIMQRERPPSPASFFSSSAPSMWSLPTNATHMCDPPGSTKMLAQDRADTASLLLPLSLRNLNKSPSLIGNPRAKKRKLVISGIPSGDQRRYDQLRRWCESFGELNQITRIPNGDLHVDFRRSEVAETVSTPHDPATPRLILCDRCAACTRGSK